MQTEMLIHVETSDHGRVEISTTLGDVRVEGQRRDGVDWESHGDMLIMGPREAAVVGRALIQAAKFVEDNDAD